ncbi:FecR domain-containing protein [Maribacter sp. BPC-D8]|uniref:FecR family protein n=1 Tax=Maribacter sp. BPC-D8 TaxID=3053613 RepID=UPI002B486B11|nr:FecR domain-containing protein [Maribacter sp. BPC-D8]WRI27949.1 FecR domain-containing protein [Maribacter sp. BPC-D8]
MQDNYLAKWLNDELNEAELVEFKKSEAYDTYQKIKASAAQLESPEFDMDKAWASIEETKSVEETKVFILSPFKKFLRVAAVVAVLLTASFFYLNTLNESYTTEYAENKLITLPDTSEVILNAESELAFSEKKWDANRNVDLKGEAYFKVAKGKKFTVETAEGLVTVLGTQFNVETREDYFEVTCFEGLVSVTINGEETKLPAGNSLLAINGKSTMSKATINGEPTWLSKESSFKSIPLHYVLDELQRQFNIEVSAKDIDTAQLFTGSFSNENLELALKSISVPLQIKFNLDGNKVLFYAEEAP